MTDIVFVELPDVGRTVAAQEAIVVLESVKSVADVYAVMAGEIVEVNTPLVEHPELVNESPYEQGWLYKLKVASPDTSAMMDAAAYGKFLESQ